MYAFIASRGMHGATCDEVIEALDMLQQTAYPRRSELLRDGELVKTGEKRRTHRGGVLAAVVVTRKVWDDHQWRLAHPVHYRRPEQALLL